MIKLASSIWLSLLSFQALADPNFDGMYIGNLIGEKNVLDIRSLGGSAIGDLWISAQQKLVFLGQSNYPHLEGRLSLLNGQSMTLHAEAHHDTLLVQLVLNSDSAQINRGVFIKQSSKVDVSKVFGKMKYELDSRLFGYWKLYREIQGGKSVTTEDWYTIEFQKNGWQYIHSRKLDEKINRNKMNGFQPKVKWQTSDGSIVTKSG